MAIKKTLIDNSEGLKMASILRELIDYNNYPEICIATGYWDLPGTKMVMDKLLPFLEAGGHLQLLIGQEPMLRSYQFDANCDNVNKFPDFYIKRDIDLLSDEYKPVVEMLLKYCTDQDDSPIQIRVFGQDCEKRQFLHAKCYIFKCKETSCAVGIIGSSNFTEKGLQDNAELNYLEDIAAIVDAKPSEYSSQKGHIYWFDERWNVSVQWNGVFLKDVLKPASITKKIIEERKNRLLTPYELYIKLLQSEFADVIDKDSHKLLESYLPEKYTKLEYQIDAVNQCFSIMRRHGGFILADVVGLGKTVDGTLLIKRFIDFADLEGREKSVLIVTPPAIKSSWKKTIDDFDKENSDKMSTYIDFITTGSIVKLLEDEEDDEEIDSGEFTSELHNKNYGLIIIDESHKFRNSNTSMYQSLDNLIQEINIRTGIYPYIGLLSATPQNNRPDDLKNQIYLFERNHTYCTLADVPGRNLESFFSEISKKYSDIISSNKKTFQNISGEERNKELIEISHTIRDKVLDEILVRRTRTDIKKYYKKDLTSEGLDFPDISGPHQLKYKMDQQLCELFNRTMELIAPTDNFQFDNSDSLCYYRYRATESLIPSIKERYSGRNMTAERSSRQLARIMQILFVKRLESSFTAFKTSLHNLQRYTQNMISMYEKNSIFICPSSSIDVNSELDFDSKGCSLEECFDDIRRKIDKLDRTDKNEKKQNAEYRKGDLDPKYIKLLKRDKQLIDELCAEWDKNDYDPKFDEFKCVLEPVLFNKDTNKAQKLVIFSEAIDTVNSLKRAVENKGYKVLLITAKNRDEKEQTILENFDANYDGEWKNDYDVIITTDVLAEGVNLHRANCILNYDTPWNSTKLMQRIGRVNRIGSKGTIYVYNFMPSPEGDEKIQLINKAYIKLQSFHTLFGEDSKIFSENEQLSNYEIKKLIDGDESPYEKYLSELKQFKENNPLLYQDILTRKEKLYSATSINGDSLFVVKSPKVSGLFILIPKDSEPQILSGIEMFEKFRCSPDVEMVNLPENWEKLEEKAIFVFNQHLYKLNKRASKDVAANHAKAIIQKIIIKGISDKSDNLLQMADRLIRKGNNDMIHIINKIGERIFADQKEIFKIEQVDLDDIISKALKNFNEDIVKKSGLPYIFLGLSK